MKILDIGRKKTTRKTKLVLKMAKNQTEKFDRRYLLQSFHKQYHFFSKLYEQRFGKIKKINKLGNTNKISSTFASFGKKD